MNGKFIYDYIDEENTNLLFNLLNNNEIGQVTSDKKGY